MKLTEAHRVITGDCVFGVVAARLWNSLPPDVTTSTSLSVFKRCLKTLLFERRLQHRTLIVFFHC